jgi:hypothetical protein
MKIGDKVWVLCEVVEGAYRGHILCKNQLHYFRPLVSEVKPVEPEAVEQKKLKAIFRVKGHDRRGTVGTITRAGNWLSLFESTDGKFLRWCHDSEFDLLDESGKRISQSSEPEAVEQPTKRELTEAQKIAERTLKAIWATQPKPEPEPVEQPTSDPVNPSHCKQGGVEDLKKARWYLDRLIKEVSE